MTNKLPFKITPTIERYINEIIDFCDRWKKEHLTKPFPIPEILEIQTLQKDFGDKFTIESENNRCDFIHFLEKEGVIRYFEHLENLNNEDGVLDLPSGSQEWEGYPKIMKMEILDIKPIQKIKEGHPELFPRKQSIVCVSENTNTTNLITKNGEGDFKLGKEGELIRFKNKKRGYYRVFVSIFDLTTGSTSGSDGQVKYTDIIEYMKKQFGGNPLTVKSIQNHINNTLKRRYFKTTVDGHQILETDGSGTTLNFYNPKI